ncbi:MAG: DUF3277 family protein [Desulfuromonadales bacterium]|nr:DUF3277 family protein [Desulfuromonadales bacterium]
MAHRDRTTTYDPSQVIVTFGSLQLRGFQDGTFIKCARAEAKYTTKAGADGETARTRNLNRAGTVEVTLLQTSVSNAELLAKHIADENSAGGLTPEPLVVKDLNGNSLTVAGEAWIEKAPNEEYAKEVGGRVWIFGTGNLRLGPAGN